MRRAAGNLLLLVLSIGLSFVAGELAVRIFAPQDLSGTWRVTAPSGGYQINKAQGSARHQLGPRVVTYEFAPFHLRALTAGQTAAQRVLVLGDSFAFGWLLAAENTFVGRLQQAADQQFGPGKIAFLNAAAGGWGTADYVAYYEDFGAAINAQTILVFLNTDDIGRSLESKLYELSGGAAVLTRRPPGRASTLKTVLNGIPFYDEALERSHLMQLLRRAVLRHTAPQAFARDGGHAPVPGSAENGPATGDKGRQLGEALFSRLIQLSHERNQRLLVLTTGWHRFKAASPHEPTSAFMAGARDFFRDRNIAFHDISDAVYERAGGTTSEIAIPGDGHPNEKGAQIIAEESWKVLSGLLSE